MWRAFFFAVGATFIILGAQGLVVDYIVIANGTRVPRVIAKFLDGGGERKQAGQRGVAVPLGNPNLAQQVATNAQRSSQRSLTDLANQTGSRFGPSRFGDSQFSNTNLPGNISYYGGVPFSNRQSPNSQTQFSGGPTGPNSQFSLAGFDGGGQGFGNPAKGQVGGVQVGQGGQLAPVTLGKGGSRLVRPAEWMPWGLLAIGTLVVLYTKSTGRGFSAE